MAVLTMNTALIDLTVIKYGINQYIHFLTVKNEKLLSNLDISKKTSVNHPFCIHISHKVYPNMQSHVGNKHC